jgi:hypothetical protein
MPGKKRFPGSSKSHRTFASPRKFASHSPHHTLVGIMPVLEELLNDLQFPHRSSFEQRLCGAATTLGK